MFDAFLLTRQWKDTNEGICLDLWFRAAEKSVKVEVKGQRAIFFIQQSDAQQADNLLSRLPAYEIKALELKSFDDVPVSGVYFLSQQNLYQARDVLQKNGIRCFEADIKPTDRFLTERFITGPVTIHADQADNIIYNPKLLPAEFHPCFTVLSIDIETDYSSNKIFSISFVSKVKSLTLMIGEGENTDLLFYVDNEVELLQQFIKWVQRIDPDIFIGWNVINFDFRFLQRQADQLNIALTLGRHNSTLVWRTAKTETEHYFLLIPGRVVLDGIDTLKSATYTFPSFSLEFVGTELLGRGKLIKAHESKKENEQKKDPLYKAKEIRRQFYEDKPALAAYNLEDCQLVWDIFEDTDLVGFAIERARLTGLEMDRFGGSVAAFDNLYLPRLHRKGFVAPNIGDSPSQLSAPGGYVMNSQPGFYDSVLVLDYKSLYPSIIRTFKVDPYGRIVAEIADNKQGENDEVLEIVPGFDGAHFSKTENILPDIIKQLWQARDQAKKDKNSALSQAIKIIMNSFYGVLGTPGCRIHDSRLTSSITKRSHAIIIQSVKLIEQQGYAVIYGDTDSVFVSLKEAMTNAQANVVGKRLMSLINQYWQTSLAEKYGIESYLEMEYETHFKRFFMPTIRGSVKGSKKRYAGLVEDDKGESRIIYKGLETVRTDWTSLARSFQQALYERIFSGQPYETFIRNTIRELKAGHCDSQLVYRKRLRQNLTEYVKNVPPHAQAAMKAEKFFAENNQPSRYRNASWIEYVMTVKGPEVLACQESALDYEHYIEKQLTPIADTILTAIGGEAGRTMMSVVHNQGDLFS